MTDTELKDKVKEAIGITTDDSSINANLLSKTIAVKLYLLKAGAAHLTTSITDVDIACIAIGVNDLLNNKAGETKFSPAFNILALQICRG